MRRCLRSSIPLSQPIRPMSFRQIHSSVPVQADTNFTDDFSDRSRASSMSNTNPPEIIEKPTRQNTEKDQLVYAREVSERTVRRWQESQEPKGKIQFMSMGREFTPAHNLSTPAYQLLNHQRELRAYYRKIMYEMPQFKKFARPFRPPSRYEVLRFRYTSYLGVDHPSQKKVVMTFTIRDLRNALQADSRIDDVWEHKFKLLCGPRYNFETDVVHMSCDQYPYPAQNKRWLSDKLDEMIQLATIGESFADIPLDTRHVKQKRTFKIPKDWLKLSPERQLAEKAIEEQIYLPALSRCVQFAKVSSVEAIPRPIQKRLRGIVNATVRNAVRPGFYADMNDPQVREMVISESLKHLVWSFQRVESRHAEYVTPDLSEEEFERAFKEEQERIATKEREDKLRMEEDRRERLYNERQAYASSNVADEMDEVTPAELERAAEKPPTTADGQDNLNELGLDEKMLNALKLREERRKLILSRLEEDDVPEWLKHAVDTEDTEYFPMASGRFSAKKSREDILAEFFQKELDDAPVGSEEETKLMGFIQDFMEQEQSGLVQEESVEEIKKRVNAMLKEIEDRKEKQT